MSVGPETWGSGMVVRTAFIWASNHRDNRPGSVIRVHAPEAAMVRRSRPRANEGHS